MLRRGRVEVTGGFLLLMAWLNYTDAQGLLPLGLLACALHEGGHWLAIRLSGGQVARLRLTAVGAQIQPIGTMSYPAELLCALAGPCVNLVMWLLAARGGAYVFAGMNAALGLFNLLPLGVLDGGRALGCIGSWLLGPGVALRAIGWMQGLVAGAVVVLGAAVLGAGGGITLLTVGLWLFCPVVRKSTEKWRKRLVNGAGNG